MCPGRVSSGGYCVSMLWIGIVDGENEEMGADIVDSENSGNVVGGRVWGGTRCDPRDDLSIALGVGFVRSLSRPRFEGTGVSS